MSSPPGLQDSPAAVAECSAQGRIGLVQPQLTPRFVTVATSSALAPVSEGKRSDPYVVWGVIRLRVVIFLGVSCRWACRRAPQSLGTHRSPRSAPATTSTPRAAAASRAPSRS